MGTVQLGAPGTLPPGVAEEGGVVTLVVVHGTQRRVEPPRDARLCQPVPEITVGVVVGAERGRGQADAQAVGAAHGEVPGPERVEHGPLTAEERRDMGVVLGSVEAGPDGRGAAISEGNGHRADDGQRAAGPVVTEVARDGARIGHDVVVEEHHHVAPGGSDADVQGAELTEVGYAQRAKPRPAGGKPLQDVARPGIGPIDDHDELRDGRIGEDGVDQEGEALGPADGGEDDRRAGEQPVVGPVSFLAWGAVAGRTAELAAAVGGEARCFFPPGGRRPPVAVRWALSALATIGHLSVRRPRWVVVTNPPLPAALVAWTAGRLLGIRVAMDSHPGGFGAQGDRVAARLQWLHRWLARRVEFSIVAAEVWQHAVEAWGGRAVVVHEAPGAWEPSPARRHARLKILCVGRLAADEPWEAVLAAAADVPEVDVALTGDPTRARLAVDELPENVTCVGFLPADRYAAAVVESDVVLTLTTEPGSVMRAACEAVWAGRPLIVSDWPIDRELFPHAVHSANEPRALADAFRIADAEHERLAAMTAVARERQLARWRAQRAELLALLGAPPPGGGRRGRHRG